MTSTPEPWDDVACLRLKVDCISERFEGLSASQGLNASQLQKLRDEVVFIYEHEKKERCQMKICIVITAVLFLCVLGMQVFMICSSGWTPRSIQRPSEEVWKTNLDDFKPSDSSLLVPAAKVNKSRNSHQLKEMLMKAASANRKAEAELLVKQDLQKENADTKTEAAKEKVGTSSKLEDRLDLQPKHVSDVEVQTGNTEAHAHKDGKSLQEVSKNAGEDDPDTEYKDSDEGGDHDNGDVTAEEFGAKKRRSVSIDSFDLGSTAETADAAEGELPSHGTLSRQDSIEAAEDRPTKRGMFWVCLPSKNLKKNVKKYAPVFNEISRSQKWMVYPFCYLDSEAVNSNPAYDQHFCDDVEKITFVLEMENLRSDVVTPQTSGPHWSTQFGECTERLLAEFPNGRTQFESPSWFRRIFRPQQEIHASSVEDFLNDAYSGKLLEVVPPKRDL